MQTKAAFCVYQSERTSIKLSSCVSLCLVSNAKRAGLKARNPYQTRHTYATLLLAAGESPEWIANQMGHTTATMLFRVYSRYVPNLMRRDGTAFEALLQTEVG